MLHKTAEGTAYVAQVEAGVQASGTGQDAPPAERKSAAEAFLRRLRPGALSAVALTLDARASREAADVARHVPIAFRLLPRRVRHVRALPAPCFAFLKPF